MNEVTSDIVTGYIVKGYIVIVKFIHTNIKL